MICLTTDLMDILYSYALDHEIAAFLSQHDGYNESIRCIQGQEKRLRTLLEKTAGSLDDLLEEQKLMELFREEACFRAGFRIAMSLAR